MVLRMNKQWMGICILPIVLGCSGGGDRPVTYPVSGRVLLDGRPVEAVDVAFMPAKALPLSRPARGRTNADGEFRLRTYISPAVDATGAVAGQYTVTLSKIDTPTGLINPEKQKPRASQLPVRYASYERSDLSAEVTSNGTNRFEFNLHNRLPAQ
jgi:hypothetical protein